MAMRESPRDAGSMEDPTPGSEDEALFLADLLLHAVRGLLNEESLEAAAKSDLRVVFRAACDRARNDGLRAEQLLLILKAAWREVSERRRLSRVEADAALARVVSACIDEYYLMPPRMGRELAQGEVSGSEGDHARADSCSAELR